jgi:hypothetical protein
MSKSQKLQSLKLQNEAVNSGNVSFVVLINAFVVVPAARALDEKRLSHNRAVVDSRKILKVSRNCMVELMKLIMPC